MPHCAVKWCVSNTRKCKNDRGVSFHAFPKDPTRREIWTKAVRLERNDNYWNPSNFSSICCIHFDNKDFYISEKGNRMLSKNAFPKCTMVPMIEKNITSSTLLDSTSIPECKEIIEPSAQKLSDADSCAKLTGQHDRQLIMCPSCGCAFNVQKPISDVANTTPELPEELNISSSEINSVLNTPKTHKLRKRLRHKTLLSTKRLAIIKSLKRTNKRILKRNVSLKDIIQELKKKGLMHTRLQTCLEDNVVEEIFSNFQRREESKTKRTILKFSPAVKRFALTLNYYSTAAYKYVREQFKLCLPHPSTLSKWYQSIDGNPGFTDEAFRALQSKYKLSEKNLACLIVDEMAIRQQKIFNGKDVEGTVSFGESDEIATQAYVFMLVSLNDSFKLPLGYFFVNGFSAEQRCNMILMCLKKCHEVGAHVVSLTFDGCASNLATAKLLGCDLSDPTNLKTYFDHPSNGRPVVLILDPCHMVKLVRNTFEAKKIFKTEDDHTVEWRYFEELKKVQDELGLHFGNKLTERHLNFRNNIMSVKLATQLFSNSVANALTLCSEDLKLPQFDGVSETVKFIRIINNLFDMLNSRSLKQKGFKHPIKLAEKNKAFEFLDRAKAYIINMMIKVHTSKKTKVNGRDIILRTAALKLVTQTQSKTGFVGLLVCIESFKRLFEELVVEKSKLNFILPYKFSQDHLELFFGIIRNHGRCNNNPNARQFKGIYKKTLQNLELRSKFTGNCIPLEDFPILNCSSSTKAINITVAGFRYNDNRNEINSSKESTVEGNNCDTFSSMLDGRVQLPCLVDQIIGYISGFVARKLCAKLNCEKCTEALLATEHLYYHKLINLKDFGGLAYSSVLLFKVCYRCETVIRQIIKSETGKSLSSKHNLSVITNTCFQHVAGFADLFPSRRSDCGHYMFLIKSIIEEFLKVRLHYIARNESLLVSSRQKLTKLTIFQGT